MEMKDVQMILNMFKHSGYHDLWARGEKIQH